MTKLAEIEVAAAKLSRREQRQLHTFLTRRLEAEQSRKKKTGDPLAAMKVHWQRVRALTHGQSVLTARAQKRFDRALRGE